MSTENYNGYGNKETWTLAVWIKTDESLMNYWKYKAKTLTEDELTKELQTYFEDRNPLTKDFNFYGDLLNNSLKLIKWGEVARSLKEEE
jgi:hypothetical protein